MREMTALDLNADLGESFGHWRLGDDQELVRHLTSANVACGFHAGDFGVMDRTVALCRAAGVAVGAHPGYPDLLGFGRRPMPYTPEETEQLVLYQIGALAAICHRHGVELAHVAAHGALFTRAAVDPAIAGAVARAVAAFSSDLLLYGLAGSEPMRHAAAEANLAFVPQAFADRRYEPDGTLQSRSVAGSVIDDPETAAAQAARIATDGQAEAADGSTIQVAAGAITIHGDTPDAPRIAAAVRGRLSDVGVTVRTASGAAQHGAA